MLLQEPLGDVDFVFWGASAVASRRKWVHIRVNSLPLNCTALNESPLLGSTLAPNGHRLLYLLWVSCHRLSTHTWSPDITWRRSFILLEFSCGDVSDNAHIAYCRCLATCGDRQTSVHFGMHVGSRVCYGCRYVGTVLNRTVGPQGVLNSYQRRPLRHTELRAARPSVGAGGRGGDSKPAGTRAEVHSTLGQVGAFPLLLTAVTLAGYQVASVTTRADQVLGSSAGGCGPWHAGGKDIVGYRTTVSALLPLAETLATFASTS
jgi:hypothetical protein